MKLNGWHRLWIVFFAFWAIGTAAAYLLSQRSESQRQNMWANDLLAYLVQQVPELRKHTVASLRSTYSDISDAELIRRLREKYLPLHPAYEYGFADIDSRYASTDPLNPLAWFAIAAGPILVYALGWGFVWVRNGFDRSARPQMALRTQASKPAVGEEAKAGDKNDEDDASDGFKAYLEYNRVLRTWFVAFGVGGPAFFLVNDAIARQLVIAGRLRSVVFLFLVGAAVQVLGALLNKIANWYVYIGTIDPTMKGSRRQRFADWLISQFWIDITIDTITICSFGAAAWLLMTVFAKAV